MAQAEIEAVLPMLATGKDRLMVADLLISLQNKIACFSILNNWNITLQLINACKHLLLTRSSTKIKCPSLSLLARLAPVATPASDTVIGGDLIANTNSRPIKNGTSSVGSATTSTPLTSEMQSETINIMKIFREYSHHFDPNVRVAALNAIMVLHQRGVKLDISFYTEFCEALTDDYEECRIASIKLLNVLRQNFGDVLVCVSGGEDQICLVDDAFAKICSMMNDLSIKVRTQAASLLGEFTDVSPDFLEQTLDKKLMSNLRKKRSAHERSRESYKSGEWSSGKKWANDAPMEEIDPDCINLMEIGACGAFVQGLEDEFSEVRMASLESICKLALCFPSFAEYSLDFIVDMFNDEIENIRLKAIQCLTKISEKAIILREDQVDIVLGALEDTSADIREALHDMLGNCQLSSQYALKACTDKLLDNLRRYPEDKTSLWKCFKKLGLNHAPLAQPLAPELLMIHPFLELPEPSLEDDAYISVLILMFNAALTCPGVTKFFQDHTIRHYSYLRYSYPDLVPNISNLNSDFEVADLSSQPTGKTSEPAMRFLSAIFERIRNVMHSSRVSIDTQTSVIELSMRDLERFGEIEPSMSYASDFLRQYLVCQMSLRKILSNNNWMNAFLLSPLQSNSFRSSLQQILHTTFCLMHQFHGLHPHHLALIHQTRVKALALQLIAVIHGSNASALGLCDAFLEELLILKSHLKSDDISPDSLTKEIISEISQLNSPKPGTVARALQPLFLSSQKLLIQAADLTQLVSEETVGSLSNLRKTTAQISEPTGLSDTPLKFTAGLPLTVKLDAIVNNIKDLKIIRVKTHYPDQQNEFTPPRLSDFRLVDREQSDQEIRSYRLLTSITPTHGAWTEPCYICISIVADFRDISSSVGISQTWASRFGSGKTKPEESLMIELCKPVRLLVSPKPHRKGF